MQLLVFAAAWAGPGVLPPGIPLADERDRGETCNEGMMRGGGVRRGEDLLIIGA
jgi:hypothetical protein